MNELKVIVTGSVGVGKSVIAYKLKEFLKMEGFDVEFGGSNDFESEVQFDDATSRHLDRNLEAVIQKTKIVVYDIQQQKLRKSITAKEYIAQLPDGFETCISITKSKDIPHSMMFTKSRRKKD